MILTRYAMRGFELGKEFLGVPSLSFPGLLQTLTDTFASFGSSGNIQQALTGFGILHVGFGFTFDRGHHLAIAPF